MRTEAHTLTKSGIDEAFGVYDCDPEDITEPFPGWVLTPENPSPNNSIILRFTADCGITFLTGSGEEVPAHGEVRLTDIEVEEFDPLTDEDDAPTNFLLEIDVAPVGLVPETIARVNFAAEYDAGGFPTSLTVGDPNATGPNLELDSGTMGQDLSAVFQMFDATSSYSIRFGAAISGFVAETEMVDAITLEFGYGETSNPANPPFQFDVTGDNFRPDPQDEFNTLADVSGSIRHQNKVLASLAGDTTEVQVNVDVNGDEVVDEFDTCPNVDITFSDDPQNPQNICEAMDELVELLDGVLGGVALLAVDLNR